MPNHTVHFDFALAAAPLVVSYYNPDGELEWERGYASVSSAMDDVENWCARGEMPEE